MSAPESLDEALRAGWGEEDPPCEDETTGRAPVVELVSERVRRRYRRAAQERKARSDVRVNRHLVTVMSGATAFSHTRNRGRSVAGPQTPGGKS